MDYEQQQVTEIYCVFQVNMAAIIKAGRGAFNEWVIGKMGKYTQNFKAKNSLSLYLAVTHSHLL
jgi:hypothetical protein